MSAAGRWTAAALTGLLCGAGSGTAVTCTALNVDQAVTAYAQKACAIIQSKQTFYTGKNAAAVSILAKTNLVFLGDRERFYGMYELKPGSYRIVALDAARPTSFYTRDIAAIGFALRDFRYQMAALAQQRQDGRARQLLAAPMFTELFSFASDESLVIPLNEAGQTRGRVTYVPSNGEGIEVGVATNIEVVLNRTRTTTMQGASTLTAAGRAARFLGLRY